MRVVLQRKTKKWSLRKLDHLGDFLLENLICRLQNLEKEIEEIGDIIEKKRHLGPRILIMQRNSKVYKHNLIIEFISRNYPHFNCAENGFCCFQTWAMEKRSHRKSNKL